MLEADKRNRSNDLDWMHACFASRGSPVRSRSRPPNLCANSIDCSWTF